MLRLIALPILFIVLGLPGIFGLFVSLDPSSAVEGTLSVLSSSVTSLLIMGPKPCDCVGVMFGVSSTPWLVCPSLRAVLTCSRGFGFSGVGVCRSSLAVESASRAAAVLGTGLETASEAESSETDVRGSDSEESAIWLHICDFRSVGMRMRLYDSSRPNSGRLMIVEVGALC